LKLRKILKKGTAKMCQDQPHHADAYTLDVQPGDILIAATDGVFDNLFNYEILQMIQETHFTELARKIVEAAKAKVNSQNVTTPYQRKYKRAYNCVWEGGKDDDITCVVTLVH